MIQALLKKILNFNSQLSLRLLIWVVMCSSFFALLVSAFQLYTDYRRDVSSIHSSIQFIHDSYLKTLSTNAYNMNLQQLSLQLEGILKLQDIEYLEVVEKSENSEILLATAGDMKARRDIEKEFILKYPVVAGLDTQYSMLRVRASLSGVYQRLWDKAFIILISNMVKTFLASLFIFLIFQHLIVRHLVKMSDFTKDLNIDNLDSPLVLDRKPHGLYEQDELDQLVNAISNMKEGLMGSIKELKHIEDALQKSKTSFSALYNDNPLMLFTVSEEGIILSANKYGIDYMGYQKEDIVDHPIKNIFHEEDKISVQNNLKQCFAEPDNLHNWELRKVFKDNKEVWVHETARVVDDVDGKKVALIVCEDITERKLLEKQLIQSQKMEAIGHLTGGIAHDFNNLLSIFQSNFEFLEDFNTNNDADFKKWIDKGYKLVERGASLTTRLLSFSSTVTSDTKIVNINEFITDIKEFIEKLLTPKINVKLDLGDNILNININTDELQDALVNLVVNASDAMPDGGSLLIKTENIEIDKYDAYMHLGLSRGKHVLLTVSDTGCGIEEKILDNVLEPFFTTKEKGKGTGLGLSMVYGFVKRSNGCLKIYSEVGYGTSIKMYFPSCEDKEVMTTDDFTEHNMLPETGRELILVVDDEIELLHGTKYRLESLGYRVLTASSGREALDILDDHRGEITLLFSDVVMPEMSGHELAEEVQKREPDIKVLFVSGFAEDVFDGSNSHGYKILNKPYTKKELDRRLREILV
jgi:PAS domain S-box-containing protein